MIICTFIFLISSYLILFFLISGGNRLLEGKIFCFFLLWCYFATTLHYTTVFVKIVFFVGLAKNFKQIVLVIMFKKNQQ